MDEILNLAECASGQVLSALRELDLILERATRSLCVAGGTESAADPLRGLLISWSDAERAMRRDPGEPAFSSPESLYPTALPGSPLDDLRKIFSLSPFDVAVVVIALAPEIDLRYERLYAFLQDDVTRKLPSVDLILNLLCCSAQEKIERRDHFAASAPMLRHGIIHRMADPPCEHTPLLAQFVKLDERITQYVLGQQGLDPRLLDLCSLATAVPVLEELPLSSSVAAILPNVIEVLKTEEAGSVVCLRGGSPSQMRPVATALAAGAGMGLLSADLSRSAETGLALTEKLMLVLREARLQCALPYLENFDQVEGSVLSRTLARAQGSVILGSAKLESFAAVNDRTVITVEFQPLDVRQRRNWWESNLARHDVFVDGNTLDVLASRYRLTTEQIEKAAREGCAHALARVRTTSERANASTTPSALFAAARAQSAPLATLARRIQPKQSWGDLVLPDDTVRQLREFCGRVARSEDVLGAWGFGQKLSYGKGATALFAGASGTGKSSAVEVLAHELHLDLYRIDLASVICKYIGETEKNLDRIFTGAEGSNAILLFDEADALFGKRTEVRDSHDRYANIETSYLLQKMEDYQGATILATNLSQNLDDAFLRRLAFTIRFPFPDEAARWRIWNAVWPPETPLEDGLDFHYLAAAFKLSGGNIKNIALAAAFLAAEEGSPVTMTHLLRGVEREYQKMGKSVRTEGLVAEFERIRNPAAAS